MDKTTDDIHWSDFDPEKVESPALKRLIEEVRREDTEPRSYDRIHNRHNRS